MRRGILVALSGIALMTVGSMWLVVAMEDRAPVEPARMPAAAIGTAPDAPPVASRRDAPSSPSSPPAAAPAPARDEAPPAWELPRDPARRLKALQPLQEEVRAELERLDARAGCDLRDASVTLTLETGDGEVHVVDAVARRRIPAPDPVGSDAAGGDVDEAVARCVSERIRGMTFRAPSARPGRRWVTIHSPSMPR